MLFYWSRSSRPTMQCCVQPEPCHNVRIHGTTWRHAEPLASGRLTNTISAGTHTVPGTSLRASWAQGGFIVGTLPLRVSLNTYTLNTAVPLPHVSSPDSAASSGLPPRQRLPSPDSSVCSASKVSLLSSHTFARNTILSSSWSVCSNSNRTSTSVVKGGPPKKLSFCTYTAQHSTAQHSTAHRAGT